MKQELFKRILSSIILIPLTFFFIIKGSYLFNFFLIIFLLITLYEWHNMSKKKNFYIFGIIFIIFSFICIYNLRHDFDKGYIYVLLIVIVCVSTDIGGYTFGRIFKGPKLTKISPKKTYSGMIGAYLLTLFSVYLILNTSLLNIILVSTLDLLVFVLIISTVSQLGDLVISYFKRLSKIKDTGNIIPGHGGILDRIDGMIFAFPFSYFIFLTKTIEIF
tara:strand:- start:511 stop:1164 length:654 start_codon:yes stop_codon:yes gene_type:complete